MTATNPRPLTLSEQAWVDWLTREVLAGRTT